MTVGSGTGNAEGTTEARRRDARDPLPAWAVALVEGMTAGDVGGGEGGVAEGGVRRRERGATGE